MPPPRERRRREQLAAEIDQAGRWLVDACALVLDPTVSDPDLRDAILARVGRDRLQEAIGRLREHVRPVEEGHREWTMCHSDRLIRRIASFKPGEEPISYRRLGRMEARTIIAGHRALPVHPVEDRTISVREAALVQGFPLDYFFCGPRAEQPLQVANAVPPALAAVVARHLKSWV